MHDLDAEAQLHFEYFQFKELLVNITKHQLVPKHQLLNNDEKLKLLER
jgi:DNA-directed RNA polymerase I, II, and III subunit RPABC1